jgi:ferrous iron transport protein A
MSMTLNQLKLGETATITALNAKGMDRRRLMDLGILPGTRLVAELKSPLGDPVAYRVRDTLIAIRNAQASQIEIEQMEGNPT